MISADIKADAKQEIKELVAASYNVSQKYLFKTWSIFNLVLVRIPSSLILSFRTGGWRIVYFMTKSNKHGES